MDSLDACSRRSPLRILESGVLRYGHRPGGPAEDTRGGFTHGDELQLNGGVRPTRSLHEAGLVDIDRLLVASVVVGSGSRLFAADGPAHSLAVTSGTVTGGGVTSLEMEPPRDGAAS